MKLLKGRWQDASGHNLSADFVDRQLQQLEEHFHKQSPVLAQFLLKGLLELVEGEQDFLLEPEEWAVLSLEQIDFLTEHLEDVLQDLTDNRTNLAETVTEIQELVTEHNDLEEAYMERMGKLAEASSDELNQLSQELAAIQVLTEDVEDMLLERQRLEEDIKALLVQLTSLLYRALGQS